MADEYVVHAARVKKELPATGQRGPLKVWSLDLKGPDGETVQAERKKRPDNSINVGDKLFGYLEEREGFPADFREIQRDGQGRQGGGGGRAQSADQFERRPDHPLNAARMRHTSAIWAAPEYYRLFREESVVAKPESKAQMVETLGGIVRWLEDGYPADPRNET